MIFQDIAVLEVFFEATTAIQFSTYATQTWVDYFANVGGLLGLCIGLSIITLVELAWLGMKLAWRTKEILIDEKKESKRNNIVDAMNKVAWQKKEYQG